MRVVPNVCGWSAHSPHTLPNCLLVAAAAATAAAAAAVVVISGMVGILYER